MRLASVTCPLTAPAPQGEGERRVCPDHIVCGFGLVSRSAWLRESICLASWVEPFQGSGSTVLQPRVARSSRPWAGGRNPFGIGKALNTYSPQEEGGEEPIIPLPRSLWQFPLSRQ